MLPLSFSLDTGITSEMTLIEFQSPKSFSPELRPKTPQVVNHIKRHCGTRLQKVQKRILLQTGVSEESREAN